MLELKWDKGEETDGESDIWIWRILIWGDTYEKWKSVVFIWKIEKKE